MCIRKIIRRLTVAGKTITQRIIVNAEKSNFICLKLQNACRRAGTEARKGGIVEVYCIWRSVFFIEKICIELDTAGVC